MLERGGASATLRTARLPGPFHMTGALLRYRHLNSAERMRALFGGVRLLAMQRREADRLKQMTVAQLMDHLGQGPRLRACFWYPLAIATLNDEPEVSSAALLAEVLKRAFFGKRADSAFVYSRVGLSDLYCAPASRVIERAGGIVATRKTVQTVELDGDRVTGVVLRDGTRISADNVIAAVEPHQLQRILPDAYRDDPIFARAAQLDSSPIVCVHAWFDREVTHSAFVGFIGTTTQWLFNKRRIFEQHGEKHPGYLSFVISGARRLMDRSNDELLDVVLTDLKAMIPAASDARLTKALVLKEKHATMAPSPESFALRPTARTPINNFFLAGDWIQTGLPATIESAVISGRAAAAEISARSANAVRAAA
jgi:hydroxysqualene dehydroxylase